MESLEDTLLDDIIGENSAAIARDDLELVQEVYPSFVREDYLENQLHRSSLVLPSTTLASRTTRCLYYRAPGLGQRAMRDWLSSRT